MEFSEKDIDKLLDGIYSGKINSRNLSEELYTAIGDYLNKGVEEGFGAYKDIELFNELKENTWMFSAAKTYQQTKDIAALMYDINGDLVGHKQFNVLGKKLFDTWNSVWGATEYNTAVGQASMASQWSEIQANKDILPMLRYSAIGDACEICRPLDGITAPVNSSIWNKVTPLNHFNCLCVLLQEDETVKETPGNKKAVAEVEKKMDDTFKMNAGKDGYVFSPKHPYFKVEKKDKALAKRNFGLPMPE